MSPSFSERTPARTDSVPRVRISHPALLRNAQRLVDGLPRGSRVVDLRDDALGHGALGCAATLARAGVETAIVDESASLAMPDAAPGGLRIVTSGRATIDAATLFGLADLSAPVMRLAGTVLGVKPLRAGEGVSYGYAHRATHDTRVALVTGGYAQGVVRSLGGRARVRVAGGTHPIVGRVAMDVCVVDIADAAAGRGDEVVFFGDPEAGEPAVREWAELTGLTVGEIVTAVGARVRREDA
ncbi:alanine racemase C-terminal domain-containing protein [Microbacterium sp. BWT-B31]|uniref:alanine racemase C-terminal domain-containing protein n=1 Tax=Microbacterium sp. BWT-B31 TaxID=3232072 RepID=UPI003528657E